MKHSLFEPLENIDLTPVLPPLGRPPRNKERQTKYFKIHLTQDEFDLYHAKFDKVAKICQKNDLAFNK